MYGTAHLKSAKDLLPLQAAFEAAPHDVKIIVKIARFFARRGMLPGAITYMCQALGIQPENSVFHRELGKYYNQLGRNDDALYHIRRAVELNPRDAEGLRVLGVALCSVKQFKAAIRVLSDASEVSGRRDLSLCMLARACFENGDFDASVKYTERAVAIRNGSASQARENLADAYAQVGNFDKAIYHATKIIKSKPARGLTILANILNGANLPEKAAEICRRALKLEPNNPSLHFSHAWSILMLGDYEKGWDEYEWRLRSNPNHLDAGKFRAPLTQAMWAGEDLTGKTILVHGEQGFGDNIQFIRYVQPLLKLGAKVIVLAPPPLASLFSRIPGIVSCGAYMEMLPRYDYHIVAGSLPRRFTHHIHEIPSKTPYLIAPERPPSFFRVKRKKSLNVGVCWGGNKLAPTDRRAIDIDFFARLFCLKGVDFYSLQVGPKSEEINPYLNTHVFDVAAILNDFADTAAVLERLDLLVTVDSGIAHLAGALGGNVFTLLPFAADWRWLKNDPNSPYYEVTPWYPKMRLFRQPRFGDWESVFKKLMLALKKELKSKPSSGSYRTRILPDQTERTMPLLPKSQDTQKDGHQLFKPRTFEEGMATVIGECNGLTTQVRWEKETPAFAEGILRLLPADAKTLLDYGCGVGRLAKEILKQNESVTVIGVDDSEEELALARRYVDSPRFVTMKPQKLCGTIDLVYSVYVLQHIPAVEIREVLQRVHNYLRTDGLFIYCSSNCRMAIRFDEPGFEDDRRFGVNIGREISRYFVPCGELFTEKILEQNPVLNMMITGGNGGSPHPALIFRKRIQDKPLFNYAFDG